VKTAFRESFDSDLSVITDASLLRRIHPVHRDQDIGDVRGVRRGRARARIRPDAAAGTGSLRADCQEE